MNAPRFSVVIPSRNAERYLGPAITTVLGQDYSNFELIVSDNHSSDNTSRMLEGIRDPRLRVVRPPKPLAMTQHFEWVLQQTRGEWITLMGDDDGLMPFFFDFAEAVTAGPASGLEAVYGPKPSYHWPGLENLYGQTAIRFNAHSGREIEKSCSAIERLAYGHESYIRHVQFYTGTIFRRTLLERIRSRQAGGRVFHTFTPDADSVVAILLNTEKILKVGLPFAWGGASPKSNGAQAAIEQSGAEGPTDRFKEFKAMNEAAGLTGHPRFCANLNVEGCAKVYFLESLYSMSLANGYGWHERFDDVKHKYQLFYSIFEEREVRRCRGQSIWAYDKLFADNGLSLEAFRALEPAKRRAKALRFFERKRQGLLRAIRRTLPGPLKAFSFRSNDMKAFPTIIEANKLLEEPHNRARFREMIDKICK